MKNEKILMTKTVQTRLLVSLSEPDKELTINKSEPEDNSGLLLQVFDNLNSLYEKLNRLNYVIERKNIEQILHQKCKGETKQNEN